MKKVVSVFLIAITGIILGLASCTSEVDIPAAEENNVSGSSKTADSTVVAPDVPVPPVEEGETQLPYNEADTIRISGNDIKSFNIATSEIIFANSSLTNSLSNRIFGLSVYLALYLDGKPLFLADVYSALSSWRYNDLVFSVSGSKFYLGIGFPSDDLLGTNETNSLQERKENAQKRKAEWDAFIKYLNETGKIIQ
ncbi:MAG: hypothetical protein LBH04_05540 [Tannerellaceae bacterium]|jgi:hypothetical protein|nr:hypothetical protein [Tannerellaceae bacterium]